MINTDDKKINELLTRAVEEVIDRNELKKKLKSGDQLTVKLGIDPTSPNIHLGRAIPLLKLRDFQQLGHKIVFIIGDFTGIIGDTSDKDSERPMLDEESIEQNMRTYIEQAGKILNIKECEIYHNSEWLKDLKYKEILDQANIFSVNDFISRDNIANRLDEGKRVSLREVLYPLMQGYDSVVIKADVELGGTDQRFNLLSGRDMQKYYNQNPQNIMTNPLIEGLDGRKMSSSWGNTINLNDSARDMFGKIMSIGDELILKYFEYITRVDVEIIHDYKNAMESGENPRDYKLKLAFEIVSMFYSSDLAEKEKKYFIETFSKKEIPTEIREFEPKDYKLSSFLIETNLCDSNSDVRRILQQGGIKVNEETVSSTNILLKKGDIVQKGKINFFKVG
jgi:tyrosyl-tRNA synthetase